MSELRDTLTKILQGQSAGYYAYPNASAFALEGIDPATAAGELDAMEKDGLVEREQVEQIVETSDQVFLRMSEKERKKLKGALPQPRTETVPGGYRLKKKTR